MSSIKLENVVKVYTSKKEKNNIKQSNTKKKTQTTNNEIVAVHTFNLDIKDKEFVVFVGPSGCGKSTVLRMIAGLEKITKGSIYIDGERINEKQPKDRNVAMVFQNYALYPHMSVYDNIAFPLSVRKENIKEIEKKVYEAADVLNITDLLNRKPKELSGGERQRVAIGRAIVRNPSVFLMDEPLSNLDAKLRNMMRAEIIKLRERIDTTYIYVTHDQTEAMTLGDRIVVMRYGYIQQIGTPQEVFNHPQNVFVASFIGSPQMNFFDAKLVKENFKYFVELEGIRFQLSEEKCKKLIKNNIEERNIILGVRPEHIFISDKGIKTKIEVLEMMGSSVHLHARISNKDIIAIVQINEDCNFSKGDIINLNFSEKTMHIFDKETEANLEK